MGRRAVARRARLNVRVRLRRRPGAKRFSVPRRRSGGVGRLVGLLMVALPLAIAAPAVYADAIPGATYTGVAEDGATVGFTVSSDGTLVDSYRIGDSKGDHCTFYAEGDMGSWEGAPINGGAFEYHLYNSFFLSGSFTGPQSAEGTFQFHNAALGGAPACDTGVVSWTATTTATPPSGSGAGGASGGKGGSGVGGAGGGNVQGNGVGPGSHASRPKFATRVVLRKLSAKRLGGQIRTATRACRSGRTLILWLGSRRIRSMRPLAGGRYSFPRTARLRGRRVRVTVLARSVPAGMCAAGSSKFIRA